MAVSRLDREARAERLATWRPLGFLQDLVHTVADTWRVVDENHAALIRLENKMADVSGVLNQVADGLRGPLATSITELLAERDRLAADNATLSGEDAAESTAAANVRSAFDGVAALFAPVDEVPDVEPLPEPAPVEETPGDTTTDESSDGTPVA